MFFLSSHHLLCAVSVLYFLLHARFCLKWHLPAHLAAIVLVL
jgi:hypothetical protein